MDLFGIFGMATYRPLELKFHPIISRAKDLNVRKRYVQLYRTRVKRSNTIHENVARVNGEQHASSRIGIVSSRFRLHYRDAIIDFIDNKNSSCDLGQRAN